MKIQLMIKSIILSIILVVSMWPTTVHQEVCVMNIEQIIEPIIEVAESVVVEAPVEAIQPVVEYTTFVLSFYTDLSDENGPYGPVNCNMERLSSGMVANNILTQGTTISTIEFGELTVSDRGGPNFDVSHRLDVFIPRDGGEDDYTYKARVLSMGMVEVQGIVRE